MKLGEVLAHTNFIESTTKQSNAIINVKDLLCLHESLNKLGFVVLVHSKL